MLLSALFLAACSGGAESTIEDRLGDHEVFTALPDGAEEMGFACAPAVDVGFCMIIYATALSPDQVASYYEQRLADGWHSLLARPDAADILAQAEWESAEYDVTVRVRDRSTWNGAPLPDEARFLVSITLAER